MVGLGDIGRAEGKDADENDDRDGDERGHRNFAHCLDTLGDAAVDEEKVQHINDDEEDTHVTDPEVQRHAVASSAGEAAKKLAVVYAGLAEPAAEGVDRVA